MPDFILDNASTIIISAVVSAVILLDIIYLVHRKKQGKNGSSLKSVGKNR